MNYLIERATVGGKNGLVITQGRRKWIHLTIKANGEHKELILCNQGDFPVMCFTGKLPSKRLINEVGGYGEYLKCCVLKNELLHWRIPQGTSLAEILHLMYTRGYILQLTQNKLIQICEQVFVQGKYDSTSIHSRMCAR